MPKNHVAPHEEIWSLSGTVKHWIYGPRGEAQGLMLDVDGAAVQFAVGPHDAGPLAALATGQAVEIEGTFAGTADHDVYHFTRLVSPASKVAASPAHPVTGTVVRINHAKHGEPNGVVLDTGDFVHTKPHGFAALGLKLGDRVIATGERRPLFDGLGTAVEATEVNGVAL